MSKTMNRRAMLSGATILPMLAIPAIAACTAASNTSEAAEVAASQDPLYIALSKYSAGMATFNVINEVDWAAAGGEEAVIEGTYGAPMEVLENWDAPAATREGAIEALQLIIHECKWFSASSLIAPMAEAVLGYLKNVQAPDRRAVGRA